MANTFTQEGDESTALENRKSLDATGRNIILTILGIFAAILGFGIYLGTH